MSEKTSCQIRAHKLLKKSETVAHFLCIYTHNALYIHIEIRITITGYHNVKLKKFSYCHYL